MQVRSQKIQRETLNDKVEKRLREMLIDGTWAPGQRLPTEAEFSEMFGVSRLTVHVALQRLNANGLVTIRAGDGTFAQKFSLRSYLAKASELYVTEEMLDDVYAFRKLVELECARLACQRVTEEDICAMQAACDAYDQVARKGALLDEENMRARVEADLNFHFGICAASHNTMYILTANAARGAVGKHLERIIPGRIQANPYLDFLPDGRTLHQYILDTIKRGDWLACQKAYLAHIDHHMANDDYQRVIDTIHSMEQQRSQSAQQAEPDENIH